MGKFVGFVGSVSGKVGTVVFCKGEGGVSYGRTYQPNVANPKTALQINQRAKMNLVGRLSQVTPKKLLVGMPGSNPRQRRSAFTSILLNSVVLDHSVPGEVVAQLDPEGVIFSQGAETLMATAATPTLNATGVTMAITLNDDSYAGRYGERIVAAIIDPSDKAGYSRLIYVDKVLDDTTAQTVALNFGVAIEEGTMVCLYRLPFVLNEQGAALYQTLAGDGENITATVVDSIGAMVRGWGKSVLEETMVFHNA